MIREGATNWAAAYLGAARGGHAGLMAWMKELEKAKTPWRRGDDLVISIAKAAYADACESGHREAAELAYTDAVSYRRTYYGVCEADRKQYQYTLQKACATGNLELVDMALRHGATDYDGGLAGALKCESRPLTAMMFGKGARAPLVLVDIFLRGRTPEYAAFYQLHCYYSLLRSASRTLFGRQKELHKVNYINKVREENGEEAESLDYYINEVATAARACAELLRLLKAAVATFEETGATDAAEMLAAAKAYVAKAEASAGVAEE